MSTTKTTGDTVNAPLTKREREDALQLTIPAIARGDADDDDDDVKKTSALYLTHEQCMKRRKSLEGDAVFAWWNRNGMDDSVPLIGTFVCQDHGSRVLIDFRATGAGAKTGNGGGCAESSCPWYLGKNGVLNVVSSDEFPAFIVGADAIRAACAGIRAERLTREKMRGSVSLAFARLRVPQPLIAAITETLAGAANNNKLWETWGFSQTITYGKGTAMLFYGKSGTGKTLAAECIAAYVGKPLKLVMASDLMSPMAGETEQNIAKTFADATKTKSVLLLDECDSFLFTRRNLGKILGSEVNQLLTSLERFDGVCVLTTNRIGTLDAAVARRIALTLEFPLPDTNTRAEIYRTLVPKQCPLAEDVDFLKLAEFGAFSGGSVKNVVLNAARRACARDAECISMEDLLVACEREAAAQGVFGRVVDARERHAASSGAEDYTRRG